jgi:hypothetical protein
MPNPYSSLPDYAFWRRAVAQVPLESFDPIVDVPFVIGTGDRIATAGSCFAQHISRMLVREGFSYVVADRERPSPGVADENFGIFSARFGNIYTVRQLLQLFRRAYGTFRPLDDIWTREDGRYVDPFRPRIEKDGFASADDVRTDRAKHLSAVREMFETCDVFVFTLGLTEGWVSTLDGAVYPLAPGVAGIGPEADAYAFENFSVDGMVADLSAFIEKLRMVNPGARVVLTVSPVPLVATYEKRHVLVSTTYSKSALRVVAEIVSNRLPDVAYFPSYEIITGPQTRYRFFSDDLREVTAEGVDSVMALFKKHFLDRKTVARHASVSLPRTGVPKTAAMPAGPPSSDLEEQYQIICDEEELDA